MTWMSLRERDWAFLDTLAARVAPESSALDEEGRGRFRAIIARALAPRPPAIVRQLRLFLAVLRNSPVARYGRRFDRLTAERQDAVLRWFQDSRIQKLRQGLWGVKTLIFMGYYGQPEVTPSLGYSPSLDGNARLHA
jgi:hypothetical protein